MTSEAYQLLQKRLINGKEYLKREYYTAYGGKGRRDIDMLKLVDMWFALCETVRQYELEHHIQAGNKNDEN